MNVLSLFDGISCARVALGNKVKTYYASEIDKNAIAVAHKNFPTTIQIGDVKLITNETIKVPIDLLIGGSPCTDLSIAKKERKGLEGNHSKLFWEYVRVKTLLNPKWFVLENVASMPIKDRDIITKTLGIEPILLDASLVSAQCRKRLFWTNIPNISQPADRKITLSSILQRDTEIAEADLLYKSDPYTKTDTKAKNAIGGRLLNRRLKDEKSGTLTSVSKDNLVIQKFVQLGYFGAKNHCCVGGQALRIYDANYKSTTSGVGYYKTLHSIRKLTPIECERLQGLPDNYTEGISKSARYKAIGNGFHTEIIKHILNQIVG